MSSLCVELRRGAVVESRHQVHVAVVDGAGQLVARAGDPAHVTFMRSAAKPFQAMPLVADGAAERFGLTSVDLALTCASHSSEPGQVDLVRALLAKIGCAERDLHCGPHRPLSDHVAKDYETQGVQLTAVYSNCSGKHAGMLALARHHGWPLEGYERLEHPVQQRCLEEVSRWTGVRADGIGTAVDGCGVICYAVPVRNMALGYARLVRGAWYVGAPGDAQAADHRQQPRTTHHARILEAMLRHPELVAGDGRPCTEMMRAHPGRVITKIGAEGVYCALLVQEGLGVALKVEDGHSVASSLAMAAVLVELGLGPLPEPLLVRPTQNSRGMRVGEMRVNGGLEK